METLTNNSRKITTLLFITQSIFSAGMIAMSTLSAIVGARISGQENLAGIPAAVYLVSIALAAYVWGNVITKAGWRIGLSAGLMIGGVGGAFSFVAIQINSWTLILFSMVLIGVGSAAMSLSRFAAAEVNPPVSRGKAVSTVVLGGTVGAIFGPLMVGPTGQAAVMFGASELGGAYVFGSVLFILAALVVFFGLRPEPKLIGDQISQMYPEAMLDSGEKRTISVILAQSSTRLAILAMVFGQLVMVMVMVITSLHMRNHQHELSAISLVFSSHTLGMYAFSIISGRLTDSLGRGKVIAIGAGTLVAACVLAPLSGQVFPLAVALFLLGLGWNFCYVGGSTLLSDQLRPAERTQTQGFNDLLVSFVSAIGSLGSGLIYAGTGFSVMTVTGAIISLGLFGITILWLRRQKDAMLPQMPVV